MKVLWTSAVLAVLGSVSSVQAAPPSPWLAVTEGSTAYSSVSGCARAAADVLRDKGFARVSNMGSTVMGAYRSGSDYEFKAAIKCQSSSAVIFVVTTLSGQGLNKANSLLAGLRGGSSSSMGGGGDDFDDEPLDDDDMLEDEELPLEDDEAFD